MIIETGRCPRLYIKYEIVRMNIKQKSRAKPGFFTESYKCKSVISSLRVRRNRRCGCRS